MARSTLLLLALLFTAYLCQFMVLYSSHDTLQLESDNATIPTFSYHGEEVVSTRRPLSSPSSGRGWASAPASTKGAHALKDDTMFPNRVLIGIISDSHTELARGYRDRHRSLFALWNDTRLCSINDFVAAWTATSPSLLLHSQDCKVIYTFVLGAYTRPNPNVTSRVDGHGRTISTIHLGTLSNDNIDNQSTGHHQPDAPLALAQMPVWEAQYKDAFENDDVTVLNIVENMNEGKTPTFLNWASQIARRYQIPYVAKCDSDTLIRLQAMLDALQHELPARLRNDDPALSSSPSPPPLPLVLLGAMRHKAFWPSEDAQELYWRTEWYQGMHLYLSGEFYLMSTGLAEAATEEARRGMQTSKQPKFIVDYAVGHEDHDAISMCQVGHDRHNSWVTNSSTRQPAPPIRWIVVPKKARFWEHPVKGTYRWGRIWKREQRNHEARSNGTTPSLLAIQQMAASPSPSWETSQKKNLLVVLGATTLEWRRMYREAMRAQGFHICNPLAIDDKQNSMQEGCDLYQLFVLGGAGLDGTFEDVDNMDSLVLEQGIETQGENDVVTLNVKENLHDGMGQTVLYYIQERWMLQEKPAGRPSFDIILLCQSTFVVNLKRWFQNVWGPSLPLHQNHRIILGEIRDKDQKQREYPSHRHGINDVHFFHDNHENILLYMGSDCLALSTELVPVILEHARDKDASARLGIEGNLGHDLTYFAYKANRTMVHWVPITKSLRFWSPLKLD